jgi:hypothetical protein
MPWDSIGASGVSALDVSSPQAPARPGLFCPLCIGGNVTRRQGRQSSSLFFSAARRDSSRASNIQYSAIFSYALFMDGSLACAARCLASSALRRQVSLSDDIRAGSLNAPEPSGKCGVHGTSESPNPTNSRHAFYANNVAATSTIAKTNATTPENRAKSLGRVLINARSQQPAFCGP